ncbi:MAG: hypothetical protein EXQ93_01385 [Alphaproteobacteria bacterium]|nr:hypothetical protein [Alphaproteobacteria bacterium]
MFGRRSFLAGVAGSIALAGVARAQQAPSPAAGAAPAAPAAPAVTPVPGPVRRVAIASGTVAAENMLEGNGGDAGWLAFFNELKVQGFVTGTNIAFERYSGARFNGVRRLQGNSWNALGTAVGTAKPDLIVTTSSYIARGANAANADVPIVFILGDAQASGLVQNLAAPGGPMTGVTAGAGATREAMRVALLKEAVPAASKIAYLIKTQAESPTAWGAAMLAAATGTTPAFFDDVKDDVGLDATAYLRALMDAKAGGANGLVVAEGIDLSEFSALLGNYSLAMKMPGIAPYRDYVVGGGLMSFGPNYNDMFKTAATVAARVMKGEKPATIAIAQPAPELVISQRNARNLGVIIPPSVVMKAKEVLM